MTIDQARALKPGDTFWTIDLRLGEAPAAYLSERVFACFVTQGDDWIFDSAHRGFRSEDCAPTLVHAAAVAIDRIGQRIRELESLKSKVQIVPLSDEQQR